MACSRICWLRRITTSRRNSVSGSAIVATPSGDRAYVTTDSVPVVFVIDPYQNRVLARADLPGRARDLRIDPFGRYLFIRAATGDSVWVMSVGTNRVVETVRSQSGYSAARGRVHSSFITSALQS